MVKFIYNLIWWIFLIIAWFPLLVWAILRGENILHRFGFLRCKNRGGIWLHASSLGETAAAISLAKSFLAHNIPIILTATTLSGYNRLEKNAPGECEIFLQPLDHPTFVFFAMRRAAPKALVILEGDFWLGMISAAKHSGAKVIVASGAFSRKSQNLAKKIKWYYKILWENIDKIFAKSQDDLERFVSAGYSKSRIEIMPDIKLTPPPQSESAFEKQNTFPVIAAGSIRSTEEDTVIAAFIEIGEKFPNANYIIAPRHSERISKIEEKLRNKGLAYSLKSRNGAFNNGVKILLLDTFGELAQYYAIADIAIIGGTFADYGGHNPLESIYRGTPVVHGEFISNNRAIFEMADEMGAAIKTSPEQLAQKIIEILNDKILLAEMKRGCENIIHNAQNIADEYAEKIVLEFR